MADFLCRWTDGLFDLVASQGHGAGIGTGGDLETAVLASVLTFGRARPDDPLPHFDDDRKGYWADAFAPVSGRHVGCRAWIHARSVLTEAVVERVREAVEESVRWLVEDGIAARVIVTASRTTPVRVSVRVLVVRRDGSETAVQFDDFWKSLGVNNG